MKSKQRTDIASTRKTTAIAIFTACLLFQNLTAFGGYDELKREMESYHLPLTTAEPNTSPTASKKNILTPKDILTNTNNKINTLRQGIIQDIQGIEKGKAFLALSSDLGKKLKGLDKNSGKTLDAAARLLRKNPDIYTLEGIVLMRHSGIKAARAKVEAQMNAFTQVENLDRILQRYSAFTEALMNGVGPMKGSEPIKTIFPFPGITALKGEAAAQSVKMVMSELDMAKRDAVTKMRIAFWKLIYIDKADTITSETLGLFKKLHKVANSLYRAGKTSFQDVIKITIKLNLLEDNIVSIHENRLNIKAEMLALMDLPSNIPVGTPRFFHPSGKVPPISRLYAMAHENRQELTKIRAMRGKVQRMLEMAETMILPDFDPGFSRYSDNAVMQVGSAAMKPTFSSKTASFMGAGVPIKPWLGTGIPWLEQTRRELVSLGHTLKNSEAQTRKMVRAAWSKLDKAIRSAHVYGKTVVELSSNALEVSTREYESGRLTFSEVTSSYSQWLDARLSHAGAMSDMGIARAEVQRIIGISF